MVQTRFKQVLFGANWHIQLHFSFSLIVRPQKVMNPKNKKQKNWFCEKLQKVKMKNEVGNLNLHQKVPIWTMFYYFILIVQKLNFPLCWIFKYPFKSRRKRDQYDKGQIWGSGCQQKLRIKKRIIWAKNNLDVIFVIITLKLQLF